MGLVGIIIIYSLGWADKLTIDGPSQSETHHVTNLKFVWCASNVIIFFLWEYFESPFLWHFRKSLMDSNCLSVGWLTGCSLSFWNLMGKFR